MPDLILPPDPSSPFSEKVRLIQGYKGRAWKSVVVPGTLPKPDVVALTGGHRKTPFLQSGSHICCDSALTCDVLERLQVAPPLHPASRKGLSQAFGDDRVRMRVAVPCRPVPDVTVFGPEPGGGGGLVAATRLHDTIRRVDARAGAVHVNFPRIG